MNTVLNTSEEQEANVILGVSLTPDGDLTNIDLSDQRTMSAIKRINEGRQCIFGCSIVAENPDLFKLTNTGGGYCDLSHNDEDIIFDDQITGDSLIFVKESTIKKFIGETKKFICFVYGDEYDLDEMLTNLGDKYGIKASAQNLMVKNGGCVFNILTLEKTIS